MGRARTAGEEAAAGLNVESPTVGAPCAQCPLAVIAAHALLISATPCLVNALRDWAGAVIFGGEDEEIINVAARDFAWIFRAPLRQREGAPRMREMRANDILAAVQEDGESILALMAFWAKPAISIACVVAPTKVALTWAGVRGTSAASAAEPSSRRSQCSAARSEMPSSGSPGAAAWTPIERKNER